MFQHRINSGTFKFIRNQFHLNQTQFAKLLGISRSVICRLENGKRNPTVEHLLKIEFSFGVPIAEWQMKYIEEVKRNNQHI